MHMSDALVNPGVAAAMYTMSAAATGYCAYKIKKEDKPKSLPLMGVMGAFVFAAQMLNFSIPGTGSSGHLTGALLLSVILGPFAGFLCMAAILIIQSLLFADGGMLALGCNIFNMAFYACFIAYPLCYRPLARKGGSVSIITGCILSGILSLQMGAFSVVLQTMLSGVTELPFGAFTVLMQPIHLVIGIVEGAITAAIVLFVRKARPSMLESGTSEHGISLKAMIVSIAAAVVILGGGLSLFASENPDGLEWSIEKIGAELSDNSKAVMTDYELNGEKNSKGAAGLIGAGVVFAVIAGTGAVVGIIKSRARRRS